LGSKASNPASVDYFSSTLHSDQKLGAKRDKGMFQPGLPADQEQGVPQQTT
jgi:hypothetical protein